MSLSRRTFLAQLLVGTTLVAVGRLQADAATPKRKNQNKKRPLSKKGNAAELPVVKSVGENSITVGDKYYILSDFAEVIVDGEEATLKDVKVGMQAMVTGGVKEYGDTRAETTYKATRIVARGDNQLQKKAKEANKKAAEAARKANQRNKKKKK